MTRPPFRGAPRQADGRRTCYYCGGPVNPPRRNWCGQECVDAYLIRTHGSEVRRQVKLRDKGICALCGFDAVHAEKELRRVRRDQGYIAWRDRWAEMVRRGFDHNISMWAADHIVPVVEGGGACGLENYRTLCVPCHKKETADLAKRRSKRRT